MSVEQKPGLGIRIRSVASRLAFAGALTFSSGTAIVPHVEAGGGNPQTETSSLLFQFTDEDKDLGVTFTEDLSRYKDKYYDRLFHNFDDTNQDPKYRAGAVRLAVEGAAAHGAIIEKDGKLYLYTIAHIATWLLQSGKYFPAYVPGVGVFTLLSQNFQLGEQKGKGGEPLMYYEFGQKNSVLLETKVKEGKIAPAKFSKLAPKPGDEIAITNHETGGYIKGVVVPENTEANTFAVHKQESEANYCEGASGSAGFEVDKGTITDRVVGFISTDSETSSYILDLIRNRYCVVQVDFEKVN